MAAPSLRIPLSLNLDDFQKNIEKAKSATSTATRFVLKEFTDLNSKLGGPIAASLAAGFARSMLGITAKIALVVGSFKLMGDAVESVRNQLQTMTDIADKAISTNFSPSFWQSWVEGAKGAEEKVALFEGALRNAFQALKPVLNPDWSVWDDGLTKVTAVEKAMREMRELFSTDQDFSGFSLFKNAKTQDEQTIGILTFMKQLEAIGQRVAALDLADKVFGAKFTDQIRTGQLSVDQLLDDIKTKSENAFSDKLVMRAKELDDELQNAWRTLDQNLHPSLEALDKIALDIKSVWVDIVKLMAEAADLLNKLRPASGGAPGLTAFQTDLRTTLQTKLRDPGLTPQQRNGLESQLAKIEASLVPEAPVNFDYAGGDKGASSSERVPLPKRRPEEAPPPPKPTTLAAPDRFDTSADAIAKRTAALMAEAEAQDRGTEAMNRAKIEAQLMAVAVQANTAAGKADTSATAEQRARINEVAEAYGKAAEAIEQAHVNSSISFGRKTSLLSPEDVAIAQQLKGLYPDVADALRSTDSSAINFRVIK